MNIFFGNNNWLYKYGRFESLSIVFGNVDGIKKIFGNGFGSSTPLDVVFYSELGRNIYMPVFIQKYGINHGFHLTSISTTLLDGGYLLLCIIGLFLIIQLIKCLKNLRDRSKKNFEISAIQYASTLIFIYYYIYTNVLTSVKIIGLYMIIMAMNQKNISNENVRKKEL